MSLTPKGINTTRRILSPSSAGYQEEMHEVRTAQPASVLLRAVVVRVLNDPLAYSSEEITKLKQLVSNPDLVESAPRNSLIVRIVSGGADKRGTSPVLCYPIFPSHVSLPVKSGEQVFIMYENPTAEGSLPYWLWRTPESRWVEDPNYTHADRKFDRTASVKTSEKSSSTTPTSPGFPNGGGTSTSYTLKGEKDYETILQEDPAYQDFTPEPVPRFTKRPGDLVLQGSNDALFVMGEDRQGSAKRGGPAPGTACIDMVVGRAKMPTVVRNARGTDESEKNPKGGRSAEKTEEGDPDLISDKARIAIFQSSNCDETFNLAESTPTAVEEPIPSVEDASFAVVKADEVRVVARDGGSLRLIKESAGVNACSVILLPEGTVQVDGEIIFLGREGSGSGPNGLEPYIKFSKYKEQMTQVITEVNSVLTALISAFAVPVAAPGVPHPGLTSSIPNVSSALTNLEALKLRLDEAQSSRIFGE